MLSSSRQRRIIGLLVFALIPWPVWSGSVQAPDPGPADTCPVCGMFVAKYPEWVATVTYPDGHAHHFDGAKDLFKYLLDMPKWAPGHRAEDIEVIAVTEYYGLSRIDARDAHYVIGSDVLGPMGHELIPLETVEDAAEFLADHVGRRTLRFDEVTVDLLRNLDNGHFDWRASAGSEKQASRLRQCCVDSLGLLVRGRHPWLPALATHPAVHGRTFVFSRCKGLKMKVFGNRIFECRAEFGQDGQ